MTTSLAMKLSVLILTATSAAFAVPAAAFTFQDNPSSFWSGDDLTTGTFTGNTFTWHNLFARNDTSGALPSLSFVVPFVWPVVGASTPGETQVPMEWRNDLNGWFSNDFNNTGTSLTVTLANPNASSIAMGQIADLSGSAQYPLTEPCSSGSPSCVPAPYPQETRELGDKIPVLSLGAFAPNETKRFDLSFNYAYGDQRGGALQTALVGHTISPIPEPETYAMFLIGLGLLGLWARHRGGILAL